MNVLLVGLPQSQLLYGSATTDPPVPLAAGYIAAYAREHPRLRSRIEVSVLRHVLGRPLEQDDNDEGLLQRILLYRPDVVGFSCYLWNIRRIAHLTQLLKKVDSSIHVIWGGPEVGFGPENALRRNRWVDVVVAGEGEETFVELLEHFLDGRPSLDQVAGIAYRDRDGDIVRTAPRSPITDLDSIPSPWLSGLLDPKEQPEGNRMLIETYRECPFRCGFCTSPGIPRKYSMRRIRQELELAVSHDLDSVTIADPLFNLDRKRLRALADIAEDLSPDRGIFTRAILMAELVTDDTVEQLRRLRIRVADLGLQSTNPVVLENIRRKLKPDVYRDAIARLNDAGILINMQTIAGLPGDDLDGLRRTLDFAISLEPHILSSFSPLMLEGSYLCQMRRELQIVWDEEPPHRILSHCSLDYDQMLEVLEVGSTITGEYRRARAERRRARQGKPQQGESQGRGPKVTGSTGDLGNGKENTEENAREPRIRRFDPMTAV